MISIDRSSRRPTMVLIILAVLIGAGLVWWYLSQPSSDDVPGGVVATASAPAAASMQATQPAATQPAMTTLEGKGRQDAMAALPTGGQEFQRVANYLHFQKLFERFQALTQESKDPKLRQASAQQLYDMLPERVRLSELTLPEGALLCGVFLEEMEPNEAQRTQKAIACGQNLERLAPKIETEQQILMMQCQQEYRRREATLVSEYQAQSPSERNPGKLEKDLDQAKHAVFDSPTCGL